MEDLILEATVNTPKTEFFGNGHLVMEGRSLPEDVSKFFDPLINWVQELNVEVVKFDINLEYFNSASSKKLMELFKYLDANNNIKELYINWHYEEGDEDNVETAEIFEDSLLKAQFRYFEYAEAA